MTKLEYIRRLKRMLTHRKNICSDIYKITANELYLMGGEDIKKKREYTMVNLYDPALARSGPFG